MGHRSRCAATPCEDAVGMKPLASPVIEYRLIGVLSLAAAAVFGVVTLVEGPAAGLVRFLFMTAFFGGFMYVVAYRRTCANAVKEAREISDPKREAPFATKRRAALMAFATLVAMTALAFLFQDPALIGGITAGNGAAVLATGRWIERWEQEHSVQVLREPRWRWSSSGERGWGRGRGVMDPQDFYLVGS